MKSTDTISIEVTCQTVVAGSLVQNPRTPNHTHTRTPIVGLFAFCLLLSANLLFSQVRYCSRKDLPKSSVDAGPFVDTLNQKIWYVGVTNSEKSKWEQLDLRDYQSFETCGNNLILHKQAGGLKVMVPDIFCSVYLEDSVFCGDSVFTMFSELSILMFDTRNNAALGVGGISDGKFVLETLNGQKGYCVYAYCRAIHSEPTANIRTWGILDRNSGNWLVPPIFDAPFQFQNGIAEVLHYGQKRKINARGEFVESLDQGSQ